MKPKKNRKSAGPANLAFSFNLFICPRHHPDHFTVNIWKTREAFLKTISGKMAMANFQVDSVETIITFKDGKETSRINSHIGTLNFSVSDLTLNSISHEILHALIAWAKNLGCLPPEIGPIKNGYHKRFDNEEIICENMGMLLEQFLIDLRSFRNGKLLKSVLKLF